MPKTDNDTLDSGRGGLTASQEAAIKQNTEALRTLIPDASQRQIRAAAARVVIGGKTIESEASAIRQRLRKRQRHEDPDD